MTKQEFIKTMKELLSIRKTEDNINDSIKELDPDFNYFSLGKIETLIVNTIKIAMNDKHDWISYWIYELNFGKDAKTGTVTDKDKKNIPIKTLSDLYNLITKNPNLK